MVQKLSPDSGRNGDQSKPTPHHVALTVVGGDTQPLSVPRTEGLAELEIRSLLWMEQKGNELQARAYLEWEKKDVLFASRIDKKRKQSSSLRNEIYQLVGFYSVFQGVLLTAVAQSNLLHCNNWWSAFSLSLLASLVTVGGVIQKFLAVLSLEKTIRNETDTRQECINRKNRLRQKRGKFNFDVDAKEGRQRKFHQTRLVASIWIVALILVAFSSLFLASIVRVLCHPNNPDPTTAAP